MIEEIDGQIERVLLRQTNLEDEVQHAKDFLAGDALVAGRRLEDEWRRSRCDAP
jgi:hypothetical protein